MGIGLLQGCIQPALGQLLCQMRASSAAKVQNHVLQVISFLIAHTKHCSFKHAETSTIAHRVLETFMDTNAIAMTLVP